MTPPRHEARSPLRRAARLAPAACAALLLLSQIASHGAARAEPSLKGSPSSLDRQNRAAARAGLSKLHSGDDIRRAAERGVVRRVEGSELFELHDVSYPYAHPDLISFIHELARFYGRSCGERLVITSLMRPISEQPRNASDRSVHPTGLAVDLRYPVRPCRARLEPALLALEREGVVEATRERRPPHYHVTLDPERYLQVAAEDGALAALFGAARPAARPAASSAASSPAPAPTESASSSSPSARRPRTHVVAEGDTLWDLSVKWGVSVKEIKRANRLRRDSLSLGQRLKVPRRRP